MSQQQPSRLISIDVGIKNMAYCIFTVSGEQLFSVETWDVANLMCQETSNAPSKCNCLIESTKKREKKRTSVLSLSPPPLPPQKVCGKTAKYMKGDIYYCEKHATQCSLYMIPKKEYSKSSLCKMNIGQLRDVSTSLEMTLENNLLKPQLLKKIHEFIENKSYIQISNKKTKTANEIDLIQIGKNMKAYFDNVLNINEITHVAIENQISPIASRMKTIQGMLAQYFIMKNSNIEIEFVSSSHKLKQFANLENNVASTATAATTTTQSETYKKHKKDAICYCSLLIEKNPQFDSWKNTLTAKKADDLADCFLQGIWFLQNKKLATIAKI